VRFVAARVASSLKVRRFVSFLLNGLAATGFALALIGLYTLLAHLVELRPREIGIRVALGARPSQVIAMILIRGGVIAASGLTIGSGPQLSQEARSGHSCSAARSQIREFGLAF
jgi:ABC-type antimicrobial peptide transport system permease subunit